MCSCGVLMGTAIFVLLETHAAALFKSTTTTATSEEPDHLMLVLPMWTTFSTCASDQLQPGTTAGDKGRGHLPHEGAAVHCGLPVPLRVPGTASELHVCTITGPEPADSCCQLCTAHVYCLLPAHAAMHTACCESDVKGMAQRIAFGHLPAEGCALPSHDDRLLHQLTEPPDCTTWCTA